MGGFCLLVELHWEGSAQQPALQAFFFFINCWYHKDKMRLKLYTLHINTALYCICTTLHCNAGFSALHCTSLHCTGVPYSLHCTASYCTASYCTALVRPTLPCVIMHCIALSLHVLYCTVQHNTFLRAIC